MHNFFLYSKTVSEKGFKIFWVHKKEVWSDYQSLKTFKKSNVKHKNEKNLTSSINYTVIIRHKQCLLGSNSLPFDCLVSLKLNSTQTFR
jgi:hypothetical protein